jgi:phosphotriesterase-related protein
MSAQENTGKVMTVLGAVQPESLGITHPHEHLFIDFLAVGAAAQGSHQIAWKQRDAGYDWNDPLTPRNYYAARRNPFLLKDTLQLSDVEEAREALEDYKEAGGGCIVDVTPIGLGRSPEGLRDLSRSTGVKVVMGTGYYLQEYHPKELAAMDERAIEDALLREIWEGVTPSGIKPGIIGEIGLVWPVHDHERKVLRAAARAQRKSGLCLTIHPGRNVAAPLDAIRTVESAGGDLTRTIIGHLDRTYFEASDFLALAKTGCYLEQDLFGWESSYFALADIDMPNDAIRINKITALADAGHIDQVLISLDIDTRARLVKYGGEGYGHLIRNVVPVMRRKGFSDADLDRILKSNPQRIVTVN